VSDNRQYDLRQHTQLSYLPRRFQRHKFQERVYREKIRTVEELQQCITEEWERLDQRVIDNAVKQWRKRLHAYVAANCGYF